MVEEIRKPGENHWPAASHWQIYHIMLYQVHLTWVGFELTTLVVIGTGCIGSCKSKLPYDHNGPMLLGFIPHYTNVSCNFIYTGIYRSVVTKWILENLQF